MFHVPDCSRSGLCSTDWEFTEGEGGAPAAPDIGLAKLALGRNGLCYGLTSSVKSYCVKTVVLAGRDGWLHSWWFVEDGHRDFSLSIDVDGKHLLTNQG